MKHKRLTAWERGEEYVGTGMSDRARAVKDLEMSARRAWHFGRLLALYTEREGYRAARNKPVYPTFPEEIKAARECFGEPRLPRVLSNRETWRWLYTVWRRGNLERQIEDVLCHIPQPSQKRVRSNMT